MQKRVVRADSCCGGCSEMADTAFDQRLETGRRRRLLVRRVLLGASVVFAVAAVVLTIMGDAQDLADRLAWAASVCAAGLMLGWVRQVVTQRRMDWRLLIGIAGVVVGVVWQPLIAALAAVVLLTEQVMGARRDEPSSADRAALPLAGQPG